MTDQNGIKSSRNEAIHCTDWNHSPLPTPGGLDA